MKYPSALFLLAFGLTVAAFHPSKPFRPASLVVLSLSEERSEAAFNPINDQDDGDDDNEEILEKVEKLGRGSAKVSCHQK